MNIVLTAIEPDLADAWNRHCGDLLDVTIYRGSILDLAVDAVVSPANSFGFMDGGIDMLYWKHFGPGIQLRLQQEIQTNRNGELLVGEAQIIKTGDARIAWLIAAPTMRVPSDIRGTTNTYLAARAALSIARLGGLNIAFPGMGTGVGQLSPDICAKQVRAAIDDVVTSRPFPQRLADAHLRHIAMTRDNPGFTVD